jgi:outer membrane protein
MSLQMIRGLSTALLLSTTCLAASAADLGEPVKKPGLPVLTEFNPWMVRVRGIGVLPGGSNKVYAGGALVAGAKVDLSNAVVPELDISYFFTKNIAAELILATSPHTAKGKGAIAGLGTLGKTWVLPPTLTIQYHFTDFGAFKPYIGVGVNYTLFYGEEHGTLNRFKVLSAAGVAAQVGFDYMIDRHWGLNVDVKKLYLRPTAKGQLAGGVPVKTKIELDPWIIGAGVTYKF